ncbi:hypothetical protein CDAR_252031 [Caerostris darwini]|uniref:Uncharacterized protein n=1 Tax=Caerostris darwini TaxID=1538125 RepID=A0AAV4VET4_9ARAC|nr:hypothetical protein CDAR_252031 [Caerostris darwini]
MLNSSTFLQIPNSSNSNPCLISFRMKSTNIFKFLGILMKRLEAFRNEKIMSLQIPNLEVYRNALEYFKVKFDQVNQDYNLAMNELTDAPTHTTTQPVAIKDLKTLPLDEDNWAERVIPAPRKDLSKLLEEEENDTTCNVIEEMTQMLGVPILPDTIQSAEMSRNTEDFLLLKDELDYEELDDNDSPSTCSVSTDRKQPSTDSGDDSRAKDSVEPIQRKRGHNVIPLEAALKIKCNESRRRTQSTPFKEKNRFVSQNLSDTTSDTNTTSTYAITKKNNIFDQDFLY